MQAAPDVFAPAQYVAAMANVDLAELGITSAARLHQAEPPEDAFRLEGIDDIGVVVHLAEGARCERCWQVLPEVGGQAAHDDLCGRCVEAVEAAGVLGVVEG